MSRILITGGAGFIGSNLADRLAGAGHEILLMDTLARPGVERNLKWLLLRHRSAVRNLQTDVRDADGVAQAVAEVDAVFHLAAQVAVTTSLSDPREDFDVNLGGTLNLLEAARQRGVPVVFASTNKVYGDLANVDLELLDGAWTPTDPGLRTAGIDERRPLDFHTPYGCSKGAADQYVLDYARSFAVPACVIRMSCIYGPRQMGTEDQGWVAHFLIRALNGETITLFGDGRQVRDILHVDDAVNAYVGALERIGQVSGRAFNLGGGAQNAVSLRQLMAHIESLTGRRADVRFEDWRAGDQRYFVADASAARAALDLPRPIGWREGVADLARWLRSSGGLVASPQTVAA
ncbi:MAG: SDR family NAD(P)-dependent oxidoreductase [Pseudomonadota bacterium]|nr:SDR family NAD(P)-dependent oxidoreductase [Pseudomonadota bacterium]